MRDWDEHELVLAGLGPADRAGLERLVETFVREKLPSDGPGSIAFAARSFEERAAALPQEKRQPVLRFAAALRERLARLRCH